MTRRNVTLVLSTGLAVLLTVLAFVIPVPYVMLSGGPIYNTTGQLDGKDVITISGRQTFPTDGELDLTTVSVRREVTLYEALRGWWDRDRAVAPTEYIFPGNESREEIRERNTAEMVQSQSDSKSAALIELGIPVTVTVSTVLEGSPSAGLLQPGDEIVAVDGAPVTSPDVLRELIQRAGVGGTVTVTYLRGDPDQPGARGEARITTVGSGEDPPRALIGIDIAVTDYPFSIDITLEDVGGPSAGLMFSLGIIDRLTPESLTGGLKIAGTGTIDVAGNVGPIGGIQQKLAAAKDSDKDVFLVPSGNCASAQENKPDDVRLVRVTTLASALDSLETLRAGGTPPDCAS